MLLVETKLGVPGFFRDRFSIALGNQDRGNWKIMRKDKNIMKKAVEEIIKLNDKYEKIGAIAAMHFAYDFLMSAQRIDFNEVDYGKYGGRLLAYVDIIKRSDGKKYSLTQELLAHGFGPDYEGERKLSVDDPDFWKKHYEANKTVIDKWYTITPEITKKKYGQNN